MQILSKIMRNVSLAFLTGGSAAIVFAAVVLVKAATAKGIPVAEAAAVNAPIFIHYGKVALVSAVALLLAELIDFMKNQNKSKLDYCRYGASALSVVAVGVFSLGIVPQMDALLPDIAKVAAAHEQFHHLHELSRAVFGASILFALVSLILPTFKKESSSAPSGPAKQLENTTANIS